MVMMFLALKMNYTWRKKNTLLLTINGLPVSVCVPVGREATAKMASWGQPLLLPLPPPE